MVATPAAADVAVAIDVKYDLWWLKYFSIKGRTTLKKNLTSLLDFLKSFLLVELEEGLTNLILGDEESK